MTAHLKPHFQMMQAHQIIDAAQDDVVRRSNGNKSLFQIFMEFDEIRDFKKALPDVSEETIHNCSVLLPARVKVNGTWMVAIYLGDEIIAWPPSEPDEFYRWSSDLKDTVYTLGDAHEYLMDGLRPRIHSTPLAWLQSGMTGIVYL